MADYYSFPDWKSIGKRIGKGLRDIINPPVGTGPTKEERSQQRLRDVLKGFTYLDTFDELIHWQIGDVDPLQRANTPLLERSESYRERCPPGVSHWTTKTLLCHDYKGGYHDYEGVRPPLLNAEMYSCEYLQFVDTFVYFSHKLVCVPPPTSTNLLHRNGVKVLGTFIIEPQTPDVERMLELVDGEFIMARQLAIMTDIFGFDGWLLNIEKEFPKGIHGLTEKLLSFIEDLKRCLGPEKQVIWYDALTANNELDYQNGLTSKNVEFAKVADSLFTNYKWTEKHLVNSKKLAEAAGIDVSRIYFGIDVWAQNTNIPGPPRITYPSKGGGGTNTGLAMKSLASTGFSTAIFAPGWAYEHFNTTLIDHSCPGDVSIAKAVDRAMWEGAKLPADLHCNCKEITQGYIGPPYRQPKAVIEGHSPHHTSEYASNPIIKYAREAPAGSADFFYTDFQRAFQTVSSGVRNQVRSLLGSLTPLPHLLTKSPANEDTEKEVFQNNLFWRLKSESAGLEIYTSQQPPGQTPEYPTTTLKLHLFNLSMPTKPGLIITTTYQTLSPISHESPEPEIPNYGIYTTYNNDHTVSHFHPITPNSNARSQSTPSATKTHTISLPMTSNYLTSIGVYHTPTPKHTFPIMTLLSLSITPSLQHLSNYSISNIRLISRSEQKRLSWDWSGSHSGRLWSHITGPFSYFEIFVDGRMVGRAYGMEFPLLEEDLEGKKSLNVTVIGHTFEGNDGISSAQLQVGIA